MLNKPLLDYSELASFYIQTPLYSLQGLPDLPEGYRIPNLDKETEENVRNITIAHRARLVFDFQGPIDCYCQRCEGASIFRRPHSGDTSPEEYLFQTFHCSRKAEHQLSFALHFDFESALVEKIGQLPSVADLAAAALLRYRKALPEGLLSEFSRALGLAAHGIGVGSFVYLRRVFERLLEDAHTRAKDSAAWNEANYAQATKMEQKIEALTGFLPEFLVKNRSMYAILSRGVHSLSEEDCLAHFPIMRAGIELILDETLERTAREMKIKEAESAIAKIRGSLKP